MLMSMTGFGEATLQEQQISCSVEVRSVNSRFLKVNSNVGEGFNCYELEIEKLVRNQVKRGTVSVYGRVTQATGAQRFQLNLAAVQSYLNQLTRLEMPGQSNSADATVGPMALAAVLQLPGIVEETARAISAEENWPLLSKTIVMAVERLQKMRQDEGSAMAAEMSNCAGAIASLVDEIEGRTGVVVKDYQERIRERVQSTIQELGVSVNASDLVREVAIFADRCDITEEITRLRSHLDQFGDALANEPNCGRKLEFLVQEIHREANTVGSKANDVAISRFVVEVKNQLERIREIVQNVE